jgi:hypothetical protein
MPNGAFADSVLQARYDITTVSANAKKMQLLGQVSHDTNHQQQLADAPC